MLFKRLLFEKFRKSKAFYASLLALGLTNAVLSVAILMVINRMLIQEPFPFFPEYDWLFFVAVVVVSLGCNKLFQTRMIKLTNEMLFSFEVSVLENLRYSTHEAFEKLGQERVFTAINDTRVVGNLPQVFMNAFNAGIVVVCGLAFMFSISPVAGAAIVGVMLTLAAFYLLKSTQLEKSLHQIRDLQDTYYRYLNDLLRGFREIKVSSTRNLTIYTHYLYKNRKEGKDLSVNTSVKYMDNELIGTYSWYVVLGSIIFLLPRLFNLSFAEASTFVVTILYLIGPIATLVTLVNGVARIKVALERLDDFDVRVKKYITPHRRQPGEGDVEKDVSVPFESIRFEKVMYEYYNEKEKRTFVLGPVDFEISSGETLFIVGGNGSGKTTFLNLLTGLYRPRSGTVYLNGKPVSGRAWEEYSDQMAVIFSDNYLFSENYNAFDFPREQEKFHAYADLMHLSGIIKSRPGVIGEEEELSKGQRKRMAMIYGLLEGKPLIVLDEWAAEQDPTFRAYFYTQVLDELTRLNKTIIMVTHDDQYYGYANRIIKFDCGVIVRDEKIVQPLEK